MATQTSASSATVPAGGTVEPANRASVAKERFQMPTEPMKERYELRDPFADTTHHSDSFTEISRKAKALGSTRFTALDADGRRTPVTLVEGQWRRGPQLEALPDRPLDDRPDGPGKPASRAKTHAQPVQVALAVEDKQNNAKLEASTERASYLEKLEAALNERYVIKRAPVSVGPVKVVGQTEYRFRGDTSRVAFTESTFKLATDINSPSVARSMVDVAQARNWKGLRISGSEDFRRLVWLEATVRGVKALGYEPSPADLELARRERDARQVNRIEPTRDSGTGTAAAPAEKSSARGSGRKATVAAIEALLVARGVPEAKRDAVLAAASEKLAQRAQAGQAVRVKVYDRSAPSQRPVLSPTPEVNRGRDRAAPVHTR